MITFSNDRRVYRELNYLIVEKCGHNQVTIRSAREVPEPVFEMQLDIAEAQEFVAAINSLLAKLPQEPKPRKTDIQVRIA